MAPHLLPTDARKDALRRALRGVLLGDDAALRAHLLATLLGRSSSVIAGVWPLAGEPDLRSLLAQLRGAGHTLALPVVAARGSPLLFRRWQPGEALVPGPFGTLHPERADAVDPNIILVPLLAFDRALHRLGRGGGFYDRTLAARHGIVTIGFAHASREVDAVPVEPHDVPLHAVVTDREVIT